MDKVKIYYDLAEILKKMGGIIPVVVNEEFIALLKDLVTSEEASVAICLSEKAMTAEEVSRKTGKPDKDVLDKLENMSNGGFLHSKKIKDGVYRYSLMPILPGIFEGQFYRGTKTLRDYQIAKRFKDFLDSTRNNHEAPIEDMPQSRLSYFRVLPVEEEVEKTQHVLPFAKLKNYVEKAENISVGTCFCRHHAMLIDENDTCGVSNQNCMIFGDMALYAAERMNGRMVGKAEAMEILKKAEEDGLVHCSSNTSEDISYMCNCCSCHCGMLRMAKASNAASKILTSGYFAKIEKDLCTACESCSQKCPVEAISVEDVATVKPEQCIGCGLCINSCPTGAISLVIKDDVKTPPAKYRNLLSEMR